VPACKWVYRSSVFVTRFRRAEITTSLDGRFLVHIMDTEQAPRSVTVSQLGEAAEDVGPQTEVLFELEDYSPLSRSVERPRLGPLCGS